MAGIPQQAGCFSPPPSRPHTPPLCPTLPEAACVPHAERSVALPVPLLSGYLGNRPVPSSLVMYVCIAGPRSSWALSCWNGGSSTQSEEEDGWVEGSVHSKHTESQGQRFHKTWRGYRGCSMPGTGPPPSALSRVKMLRRQAGFPPCSFSTGPRKWGWDSTAG